MLRLDDVQTRGELSIVKNQLVELAARKRGLSPNGTTRRNCSLEQNSVRQRCGSDGLHGRGAAFLREPPEPESQKQQLQLGISQLEEEVNGLKVQLTAKQDELALIKTEHKKIKRLTDKNLLETSRKYIIDREMAKIIGEYGEIQANIARSKARTKRNRASDHRHRRGRSDRSTA